MNTIATIFASGIAPSDEYQPITVRFKNADGSNSAKEYLYWARRGLGLCAGDTVNVSVSGAIKRPFVTHIYSQAVPGTRAKTIVGLAHRANSVGVNAPSKRCPQLDLYKHMTFGAERIESFYDLERFTRRFIVPTPSLAHQVSKPMNITITNVTYVNGQDVKDLSNERVFDLIEQAEHELKRLRAIEHKPRALDLRINELQGGIEQLVALVDARTPAAPASE